MFSHLIQVLVIQITCMILYQIALHSVPKNHEKSNSFKKLIKGFRNNGLLAECTMLQKILKKVNVWNSLENTCLNT